MTRERTTRAFLWLATLTGGPLLGAKLFDLLILALAGVGAFVVWFVANI